MCHSSFYVFQSLAWTCQGPCSRHLHVLWRWIGADRRLCRSLLPVTDYHESSHQKWFTRYCRSDGVYWLTSDYWTTRQQRLFINITHNLLFLPRLSFRNHCAFDRFWCRCPFHRVSTRFRREAVGVDGARRYCRRSHRASQFPRWASSHQSCDVSWIRPVF